MLGSKQVIFNCDKIVYMYSDASGFAFGGYCVESKYGIAHGMWNFEEVCKSSTWRELVAVFRVLLSLRHELEGNRVNGLRIIKIL